MAELNHRCSVILPLLGLGFGTLCFDPNRIFLIFFQFSVSSISFQFSTPHSIYTLDRGFDTIVKFLGSSKCILEGESGTSCFKIILNMNREREIEREAHTFGVGKGGRGGRTECSPVESRGRGCGRWHFPSLAVRPRSEELLGFFSRVQ